MRTTILLLITFCLAAGEDGWVGYGGPQGSRIYPGTAPTKFDHSKGEGVLWEAPLPSWGHGSPIFVAGKVFVLCEVSNVNLFPLLVCLDAASGEELWRAEIDHLPAITADQAKQEALRKRLRAHFDHRRDLSAEARASKEKKKPKPLSDKTFSKEAKALYQEMGLLHDGYKVQASCNHYSVIGEAYGTPVSDGEFVYAATAWGGHACFELDGKLKWMVYAPGSKNTWNNRAPSPILHKGLLIHSNAGTHRAFDCRTGELKWKHDIGFGSIATPAVITVDGKDILLTPSTKAHLLPSGEEIPVEGWRDIGMQILVKHDEPDVAFFCGSGEHCSWEKKGGGDPPNPPAALRFAFDGDKLKATVLWHGGTIGADANKRMLGGNAPWMVYHDGRFYHREGVILDALTGKPIEGLPRREKYSPKGVPVTGHLLVVCGDHVYGLAKGVRWPTSKGRDDLKGKPIATLQVTTLDGKFVADNLLLRTEPNEAQRRMHAYCTGGDERVWMEGKKNRFSYGWTFTFGDGRIYLRSIENLICIGN